MLHLPFFHSQPSLSTLKYSFAPLFLKALNIILASALLLAWFGSVDGMARRASRCLLGNLVRWVQAVLLYLRVRESFVSWREDAPASPIVPELVAVRKVLVAWLPPHTADAEDGIVP